MWIRIVASVGMVLALVLAAALPQPAAAQDQPGTQAVILCPIPVGEALNGVDVCVDRGDGAVYYEGDPITICATWNIPQIAIFPPPPPPTIRVTDSVNGSTGRLLFEESSPSGQRCVSGAIGAPFGSETSLGEAIATDGRVFATDTATFTSIPRGSDTMVDVSVTVDRGSNSSYRPGDPITICATVTSPFGGSYPVRLVDTINGQHYATFDLGSFAGVRCFPFMVVPPTGQEDLRAEVVDPQTGAVLDTGTVTIFIVA